jgi:hypothetical protein
MYILEGGKGCEKENMVLADGNRTYSGYQRLFPSQ